MSAEHSDFDLLAADIRRQPAWMAAHLPALRPAAQAAWAGGPLPRRIYLVACGDGLSAALAARFTWERLLGCPVEALPAMTFSRYAVETAPPDALVVIISQSGKVVRVIEALACAQRRGLRALVVTNKPESPLAQMVSPEQIFHLGFTRLGFTPGASAYTWTLAALYELAAALSQNESLRQELRQQIDQLPWIMAGAVDAVWEPVDEFAGRLERGQVFITLGSGPAHGTAHYSMRKLYEICQLRAALLETEEYAHDAFYAMGADTPAILFAPPDAGFRRCTEVAGYLAGAGCPLAVVSSPSRRDAFGPAAAFIGLPGSSALETSISYAVAAQALACQAGRRLGGAFYACDNPTRYADGDAQIYESARMDLEDE